MIIASVVAPESPAASATAVSRALANSDTPSQYSNLDLTARSLLGFQTPSGSRITLSSFVRPKFGTSYSIGIKDGWISYLYSSRPLLAPGPLGTSTSATAAAAATAATSSDRIPLRDLLECYRPLSSHAARHAVGHGLVYGRLYLPQNSLEALLAARVTPEVHLTLRAVSQESLRHGATLLGLAAWDDPRGRFGIETLASSDGGVLGLRGLWNATNPPSSSSGAGAEHGALLPPPSSLSTSTTTTSSSVDGPAIASSLSSSSSSSTTITTTTSAPTTNSTVPDPAYNSDKERINGRFSAGGEIYYGLLNKSGGLSVGGRFQTLPSHHGTPLTATLTFNLLGHVSATYAVTSGDCTLASSFGFNMYSYESDWAVGMELWNRRGPPSPPAAPAAAAASAPQAAVAVEKEVDQGIRTEGQEGHGNGLVHGHGRAAIEKTDMEDAAGVLIGVTDPATPTTVVRTDGTAGEAVMVVPLAPAPVAATNKSRRRERSFQAKLEWRLDDDDDDDAAIKNHDGGGGGDGGSNSSSTSGDNKSHQGSVPGGDPPTGVLKCRCDQHMRVGLLYEGRYKSLLFSLGTDVDLKKLDAPFRTVGLAVQFSS